MISSRVILTNVAVFCDQNCTVDPTQDVRKRLEVLGEAFSVRFGQAVGPLFVGLGRQVFTCAFWMKDNNGPLSYHKSEYDSYACHLSFRGSTLA